MSFRTPAVTRRQVLTALGIGAGAAAIASCSRSSSGDGRIRLAMFHAPESKLNPLTNDGSKLVRWSCAESLTRLTADGDAFAKVSGCLLESSMARGLQSFLATQAP